MRPESPEPGGRWYPVITAAFATTLVVSNIIAVKLIEVAGLTMPAAIILFPVVYILGDVLTEVYGYARARRAIWIGFGCNLLAVIAIWTAGELPAASFWDAGTYSGAPEASRAYAAILGFAPRLLLASFLAYLVGEFLNAFVLAKLKLATQGRFLWVRTIVSTIVGQGADSAIFISTAFAGLLPPGELTRAILSQWLIKSGYEAIATPLTYLVVGALKRSEALDAYDRDTDFQPLKF